MFGKHVFSFLVLLIFEFFDVSPAEKHVHLVVKARFPRQNVKGDFREGVVLMNRPVSSLSVQSLA